MNYFVFSSNQLANELMLESANMLARHSLAKSIAINHVISIESVDFDTAKSMINEVLDSIYLALFRYYHTNQQPLRDAINAVDDGDYPYMTSTLKTLWINALT